MEVVRLLARSIWNSSLDASSHTSCVDATCIDLYRFRGVLALTSQPLAVEFSTCILHIENAATLCQASVRSNRTASVNTDIVKQTLVQIVQFPTGVTVETFTEMGAVL